MYLYSQTTHAFSQKCIQYARKIINDETDLKMPRTRIIWERYSYRLDFVIFEGTQKLGYFDPNSFKVALNSSLIYLANEKTLKDIIRHELAHLITHLKYPGETSPHGPLFIKVCEQYGWAKEVQMASAELEGLNQSQEMSVQEQRILDKIQKLFKLAASSNTYESQLATMKANELLIKYNLENALNDQAKEDVFYSTEVYRSKKSNAKLNAIQSILGHFIVFPIQVKTAKGTTLEVSGKKLNVELAKYVCDFLDYEVERLWKKTQQENGLKGLRAKNSFIRGLAKGYDQKMNLMQRQQTSQKSHELILIENQLDKIKQLIYPNLSMSYSRHSSDPMASSLGQKAGGELTINKGINAPSKTYLLESSS